MIPHTRTILTSSASHQNHTVLLNVVALTRDIRRDMSAGTQAHTRRLSLAGVGFLGSLDTNFEADALLLRALRVRQGGGRVMASALACAAFL